MARPKVSVLVPTYRRTSSLRAALQSVLAQGVDSIEILVGDNDSLGGEVVAALRDSRIQYHRHATQLGMAGNWNFLLDRARGEYLALLMDDDRWLPGFLERCVAVLDADAEVGVVFTNHVFESADGGVRPRERLLEPGRHDDFAAEYVRQLPVAASAAVLRREVWHAVRPVPDTAAADLVLFGRAAAAGWPFVYVDEPLMAYALHEQQLSRVLDFLDDVVLAWESLSVPPGAAEAERRRQLAKALLDRAAAYIRAGRDAEARREVARARRLAPGAWRRRSLVLGVLARLPFLRAPALALARLRRRYARASSSA